MCSSRISRAASTTDADAPIERGSSVIAAFTTQQAWAALRLRALLEREDRGARGVAADARSTRRARGRDDGGSSRDRELHDEAAGDAAGAVNENPLAGRARCGFCEHLVGGERGHWEGGRDFPGNAGRLSCNDCG